MTRPLLVAEDTFDLAGTTETIRVRVYAPRPFERTTWGCHLKIGAPFNRDKPTYGEGSLQALSLGLNVLAANLYSSSLWREGLLGWRGRFGGYLGVPAPTSYLDFAPYPFDLGSLERRSQIIVAAADDPEPSRLVLEETLVLTDPRGPLQVRISIPERESGGRWRCRSQIDHPFEVDQYAMGDSSLEALWRALCFVAGELYGSALWRAGMISAFDEPGGFLGLPPPTSLAFLTQHSF